MKKIKYILIIFLVSTQMALGQIQRDEVKITSTAGFKLTGYYYSSGKPGPGILLLHQCNLKTSITGYEDIAPLLAKEGLHVLLLDSRGFGKSRDDKYKDYRTQMDLIDTKVPDDVEAAYQFLVSQGNVDKNKIGVIGASCGSYQAISLAKDHPEILTLVFISGSYLDLENVVQDYEEINDRPILAIYSEQDRYRTPESMRAAFAKSRNKDSKLITYKGDVHGTPLLKHDANLQNEIVIWFKAHL